MKAGKILLFCLLCLSAQGQKQHGFGIRAGWNYATLTRTTLDYSHRAYAGIYGELQLGKIFFLQPEFTYSSHGASGYLSHKQESDLGITDPQIAFLGFGIIGKVALPSQFRLLVGQYFDQALTLKKPFRNSLDPGITFGMEYKSPIGLGIDLRMKRGFSDQLDSHLYGTFISNPGIFQVDRNSNLALQLGLNYTFKL